MMFGMTTSTVRDLEDPFGRWREDEETERMVKMHIVSVGLPPVDSLEESEIEVGTGRRWRWLPDSIKARRITYIFKAIACSEAEGRGLMMFDVCFGLEVFCEKMRREKGQGKKEKGRGNEG